ncbi:hypothetical protein DTL42_00595 [Bremerella cremea]|uniref:Uncharacterized protein n=1 Tax=Bremerella cremea TaxID=1031537 RepID=A0A368KX91_9BACT|nr:hypothetical protein [Bremerella cremea]RCS55922.1 hypothetical protein DTL42_00595 [Bremerella cremea]
MGPAMIEKKINVIREASTPLIGRKIERFETAEILHHDGTWDDWPDLPIRIYGNGRTMLSVSWSRFDDLWLSNDTSLPFAVEDATTRWKPNGINKITGAIGCTIQGVSLGRGEMSIESRDIEIWTRLVFDLDGKWLEVFNALDENGYDLHLVKPDGEFRKCT